MESGLLLRKKVGDWCVLHISAKECVCVGGNMVVPYSIVFGRGVLVLYLVISACSACSVHYSISILLCLCSCETSTSSASSMVGISTSLSESVLDSLKASMTIFMIFGMSFFVRRERLVAVDLLAV